MEKKRIQAHIAGGLLLGLDGEAFFWKTPLSRGLEESQCLGIWRLGTDPGEGALLTGAMLQRALLLGWCRELKALYLVVSGKLVKNV